jgi:phage-related protein
VPIINKFKDAWDVVKKAIDNNKENFQEFIDLMQTYVLPVLKTVFGFLIDVGAKAASAIISAFGTIAGAVTPVLNFIIDSINTVIWGLNLIKIYLLYNLC